MRKKKMCMILAAGVMAFAFAGCNPKAAEPAKEAAPTATEQAAPAAAAPDTAAPEAATAGGNTMEALCDKFVTETKAANSGNLPGEAQVKDGCMQADKAYAGNPKGQEAVEAMVGYIMKACDGKTGEDWVKCYADSAQAAGEAAGKAMMAQ